MVATQNVVLGDASLNQMGSISLAILQVRLDNEWLNDTEPSFTISLRPLSSAKHEFQIAQFPQSIHSDNQQYIIKWETYI